MTCKLTLRDKRAWQTPMAVVLTRTVDETEVVLGLCKLADQDNWARSNQNDTYGLCKKQKFVCTNFCAHMSTT